MAPENLSGIPPEVTLSGLEAGPGGSFSGASQQALGGTGGAGGGIFGQVAGPDLMQLLLAQLGMGGEAGVGTGGDILQSLTQGALGQQAGGLSAGSFGQTQPGYVAGQSSAPGGPLGAAAGSPDPLSLVQKILGLAQKPLGALPTVGAASPTIGESGTPLSDQLRSAQASTASPIAGGEFAPPAGYVGPGGFEGGAKPTLPGTPSGSIGGGPLEALPLSGDGSLASLAQTFYQLGMTPEAANYFAEQVSGLQGFDTSFGALGGGLSGTEAGISGAEKPALGTASPTAGAEGSAGVNLGGLASGGVGGLLGLLQLYQGLQGGNPQGTVGGGLQTAQGIGSLLQSSPQLAEALGIGPELLSTLGSATSYVPLVGAVLAGLSAPTERTPAAQEARANQAQQAAAVSTALTLLSANPVGALFGPVLGAALAANQALNPRTNYDINKISGAVGPQATSALGTSASLFPEGDLSQVPTETLLQNLTRGTNALLPLYSSAGAGTGLTQSQTGVSRYIEGLKTADPGAYANYVANKARAEQGIGATINELLFNRGLTYQQLGQLPVSGNWALESLNAGGGPEQYYEFGQGRFDPEAQRLLAQVPNANPAPQMEQEMVQSGETWAPTGRMVPVADVQSPYYFGGQGFGGLQLSPADLLKAAQGAGAAGPPDVTKASGLVTNMYGGPLWTALARMGLPGFAGPGGLIAQNFDPWVMTRQMAPESLLSAFDPVIAARNAALQQQMAYLQGIGGGASASEGGAAGAGPGASY